MMYIPLAIDGVTYDVNNDRVLKLDPGKSKESELFSSLVKHRLNGIETVEVSEDELIDTNIFNYISLVSPLFSVRIEISLLTFSCFQFLNEAHFVDGFVIQLRDGILDINEAFYGIMFSMLEDKKDKTYCVIPEDVSDDIVRRSIDFISSMGLKTLVLG